MAAYEIRFQFDGREISQQEIREVEYSRYQKVFQQFIEKGVAITLHNRKLSESEVLALPLPEAKTALAETKERLGRDAIRDLYAKELAAADEMWKDIAANSREKENLQAGLVDVEARGITLKQFMVCNQSLARENNLTLPSMMHPEHYSFEAKAGGEQIIIETFGMYGNPTWMHLIPGKDSYRPIPLDHDTTMSMVGYTHLMSDNTNTKLIGMHQFKDWDEGLRVKLGVFLPEAAPRDMLEGHKWHLAVEFNNALHRAAEMKVNPVMSMALGLALRKMKKMR